MKTSGVVVPLMVAGVLSACSNQREVTIIVPDEFEGPLVMFKVWPEQFEGPLSDDIPRDVLEANEAGVVVRPWSGDPRAQIYVVRRSEALRLTPAQLRAPPQRSQVPTSGRVVGYCAIGINPSYNGAYVAVCVKSMDRTCLTATRLKIGAKLRTLNPTVDAWLAMSALKSSR